MSFALVSPRLGPPDERAAVGGFFNVITTSLRAIIFLFRRGSARGGFLLRCVPLFVGRNCDTFTPRVERRFER